MHQRSPDDDERRANRSDPVRRRGIAISWTVALIAALIGLGTLFAIYLIIAYAYS
jgi:hypothetical protein